MGSASKPSDKQTQRRIINHCTIGDSKQFSVCCEDQINALKMFLKISSCMYYSNSHQALVAYITTLAACTSTGADLTEGS